MTSLLIIKHMQDAVLVAKKLSVVRQGVDALRAVSFTIPRGGITGLIGPSGSGKTTLMRTIMGAQVITSGAMQVLGVAAGSKVLRSKIGYVTQSPAVYDDLTTWQNLHYFARILGLGDDEVRRTIAEVDLTRQATQLVGSMSGGQRARVSLAVALLGAPDVLVLDEPTVGLDPVLRQSLWQLFKQLADSGRTLLISSHVMDEAEQCPDLLLLRDGRVLYYGSKGSLLSSTHTKTVEGAFLYLAGTGRSDES